MTVRRILAIVVAAGLVVGAYLVRTRVIEGDGDDDSPQARPTDELVCVRDLEAVCRSLGDSGVTVTVEDASTTLERLRDVDLDELPLWLTVDPYPAMVDSLRAGARAEPAGWTTVELASSAIALVSPTAKADALATACPDPGRWECVGELAGTPWSDLDPSLRDDVRPAFAPVDRYAVGLVALGQATAGWFGTDPIDTTDPAFFAWLRQLTGQVDTQALSGGTPIRTMLTRPSALDVAVGSESELGASPDARLQVTYAGPMTSADVVLAVPAGAEVPAGLGETAASRLVATGWDPPRDDPSGAQAPSTLLALEALWEDLVR